MCVSLVMADTAAMSDPAADTTPVPRSVRHLTPVLLDPATGALTP